MTDIEPALAFLGQILCNVRFCILADFPDIWGLTAESSQWCFQRICSINRGGRDIGQSLKIINIQCSITNVQVLCFIQPLGN